VRRRGKWGVLDLKPVWPGNGAHRGAAKAVAVARNPAEVAVLRHAELSGWGHSAKEKGWDCSGSRGSKQVWKECDGRHF
jgi:hypothetical protein